MSPPRAWRPPAGKVTCSPAGPGDEFTRHGKRDICDSRRRRERVGYFVEILVQIDSHTW
ncbi:hypothetical protein J6590_051638 [Homalodisca vitripennis]|nr:hypothetical protein J6590_051638 [Homalodisca vitripennis]